MMIIHGFVNDDTVIMSARCSNKKTYVIKGSERSEPKIFVFFRRQHEILFNILSVQYILVLVYFVLIPNIPTKSQMYKMSPKLEGADDGPKMKNVNSIILRASVASENFYVQVYNQNMRFYLEIHHAK